MRHDPRDGLSFELYLEVVALDRDEDFAQSSCGYASVHELRSESPAESTVLFTQHCQVRERGEQETQR